MTPEELLSFLIGAGYVQADQVEGVCQFSRRGGILDFFPPHRGKIGKFCCSFAEFLPKKAKTLT